MFHPGVSKIEMQNLIYSLVIDYGHHGDAQKRILQTLLENVKRITTKDDVAGFLITLVNTKNALLTCDQDTDLITLRQSTIDEIEIMIHNLCDEIGQYDLKSPNWFCLALKMAYNQILYYNSMESPPADRSNNSRLFIAMANAILDNITGSITVGEDNCGLFGQWF